MPTRGAQPATPYISRPTGIPPKISVRYFLPSRSSYFWSHIPVVGEGVQTMRTPHRRETYTSRTITPSFRLYWARLGLSLKRRGRRVCLDLGRNGPRATVGGVSLPQQDVSTSRYLRHKTQPRKHIVTSCRLQGSHSGQREQLSYRSETILSPPKICLDVECEISIRVQNLITSCRLQGPPPGQREL